MIMKQSESKGNSEYINTKASESVIFSHFFSLWNKKKCMNLQNNNTPLDFKTSKQKLKYINRHTICI